MLGHWYESTRRIISPTKRSSFPIDTGIRQYEVRQQQQQQQLPSQQQNFIYFAQIYVTFRMWLDGPSVPLCPTLSCVLPWRRPGVLLSYLWRGSQGPSLPLLQLPLSVIGIAHTHHSWLLTQDIVLFRPIFIQLWGNNPLITRFFRIPSVKVPGHKGADGYPLKGMIPQMYILYTTCSSATYYIRGILFGLDGNL